MVRLNKCSSYRGSELSSDLSSEVSVKVQWEFKNSSSYWKFELSGVRVSGSVLYFLRAWKPPMQSSSRNHFRTTPFSVIYK